VSPLTGALLSRKMCSMTELDSTLSYRDALDLYEILIVHDYNHWVMSENAKESAKSGRHR
jgi:hypothetical protein